MKKLGSTSLFSLITILCFIFIKRFDAEIYTSKEKIVHEGCLFNSLYGLPVILYDDVKLMITILLQECSTSSISEQSLQIFNVSNAVKENVRVLISVVKWHMLRLLLANINGLNQNGLYGIKM